MKQFVLRVLKLWPGFVCTLSTAGLLLLSAMSDGDILDPAIFRLRPLMQEAHWFAGGFVALALLSTVTGIQLAYKASYATELRIELDNLKSEAAQTTRSLHSTRENLQSEVSSRRRAESCVAKLTIQVKDLAAAHSFIIENMRDLVEIYLENLIVNHGETVIDLNKMRVSVYQHEGTSNCFSLLGRHSGNPHWREASRRVYRAEQGVIADAWMNEETIVRDLPAWENNPGAYLAAQSIYGFSEEAVAGFKMKPRFYYAKRITSPRSGRSVGVVVLESLNPRLASKSEMRELFTPSGRWLLPDLMDKLEALIPSLDDAAKEGFN